MDCTGTKRSGACSKNLRRKTIDFDRHQQRIRNNHIHVTDLEVLTDTLTCSRASALAASFVVNVACTCKCFKPSPLRSTIWRRSKAQYFIPHIRTVRESSKHVPSATDSLQRVEPYQRGCPSEDACWRVEGSIDTMKRSTLGVYYVLKSV